MEKINDLQLDSLPVELLLYIFRHCDINDMVNLSCVCTRFYYILRDNFIWPVQYNEFIKKQTSDRFLARYAVLNLCLYLNLLQHFRYLNFYIYIYFEEIRYFIHAKSENSVFRDRGALNLNGCFPFSDANRCKYHSIFARYKILNKDRIILVSLNEKHPISHY